MNKEENKNIFTERKCSICGKEYAKFNILENGEIKNEGYYPDCDCVVESKLKKWQIPILLGAAGLGEISEGICSRLSEASEYGIDRYEETIPNLNYSRLWRKQVDSIIGQIKLQTSINLEYTESAFKDNILSAIEDFVDKEVTKRIEIYNGSGVNRGWLDRDLRLQNCFRESNELAKNNKSKGGNL